MLNSVIRIFYKHSMKKYTLHIYNRITIGYLSFDFNLLLNMVPNSCGVNKIN